MKKLSTLGIFLCLFATTILAQSESATVKAINDAYSSQLIERIENAFNKAPSISDVNDEQGPEKNCVSILLIEALQNYDRLSPDAKAYLKKMQTDLEDFADFYAPAGSYFKIWYMTEGVDAVPDVDDNHNEVPDLVEKYYNDFEYARQQYISFGLSMPDVASSGSGKGYYNIYISTSMNRDGVYGYTSPDFNSLGDNSNTKDRTEYNSVKSYIVLRSTFSALHGGSTAHDSTDAYVTATHEFQHSIQMGYDYNMSMFVMEGLAVWSEKFVHPTNNDMFMYTPDHFSYYTDLALNYNPRLESEPKTNGNADYYMQPYAGWLFFRYVTDNYSPEFVKDLYINYITKTFSSGNPTIELNAFNKTLKQYASKNAPAKYNDLIEQYYTTIAIASNSEANKPYYFSTQVADSVRKGYVRRLKTDKSFTTEGNTEQEFNSTSLSTANKRLMRLGCDFLKLNTDRNGSITLTPTTTNDSLVLIIIQYNNDNNSSKFKVTRGLATTATPVTLNYTFDPELPLIRLQVFNTSVRPRSLANKAAENATYTLKLTPSGSSSDVKEELANSSFTAKGMAPMPVNGSSELMLYVQNSGLFKYSVYNYNGQEVLNSTFSTVNGENRIPMDFSNFAPGLYSIEINNGIKTERFNFIVR
jgi:hypothetical protein